MSTGLILITGSSWDPNKQRSPNCQNVTLHYGQTDGQTGVWTERRDF